jgi:hypothetical protein
VTETDQDRQDREQAEMNQAMEEIYQKAAEALKVAAPHLTPDQLAALAWCAHLSNPEKRA